MEYVIVIHRAEEGGYWADVPALDGCFIQGETLDEVLADAPAAIASHIAAVQEDGQSVPTDTGIVLATVALPESAVA
jgi:predicted RNase H-like HicB family nuclease